MKKIASFILFIFLIFSSSNAWSKPVVYIALWDGCDEACNGFQETFKEDAFDADFIIRDAQKNIKKIAEFVWEVKATSPDLLVTWGTLVTLEMLGTEESLPSSKYVSAVPAVFMAVSQPIASGLVSSLTDQNRPITGAMTLPSMEQQLELAQKIFPFKQLGILYNPLEINAIESKNDLKNTAIAMGIGVIDKALPLLKNKNPDEKAIGSFVSDLAKQNVDMIYLGTDVFMNAHSQELAKAAETHKIPVFSASENAVTEGNALFAFVHRPYTIGLLAGKKALSILKDKVPAQKILIEAPQRPHIIWKAEPDV